MASRAGALDEDLPRCLEVGDPWDCIPQLVLFPQSLVDDLVHERSGTHWCPSLPRDSTRPQLMHSLGTRMHDSTLGSCLCVIESLVA